MQLRLLRPPGNWFNDHLRERKVSTKWHSSNNYCHIPQNTLHNNTGFLHCHILFSHELVCKQNIAESKKSTSLWATCFLNNNMSSSVVFPLSYLSCFRYLCLHSKDNYVHVTFTSFFAVFSKLHNLFAIGGIFQGFEFTALMGIPIDE